MRQLRTNSTKAPAIWTPYYADYHCRPLELMLHVYMAVRADGKQPPGVSHLASLRIRMLPEQRVCSDSRPDCQDL